MPTWTLRYNNWDNLEEDRSILRSDPAVISTTATQVNQFEAEVIVEVADHVLVNQRTFTIIQTRSIDQARVVLLASF